MFGKVLFGFFLASLFVSKKIPTYSYSIHQASPKYKHARNSFINSLCFGSEVCSRDFVGFFFRLFAGCEVAIIYAKLAYEAAKNPSDSPHV